MSEGLSVKTQSALFIISSLQGQLNL